MNASITLLYYRENVLALSYMTKAIVMDPTSSRLAIYFEDIFATCNIEDAVKLLKNIYSTVKDYQGYCPVLLWVLASALATAGLVENAYELEDKVLKLFPKNMCTLNRRLDAGEDGWDVSFLNYYLSERLDATGDLWDVHSLWKANYCIFAGNRRHHFNIVLKWKGLFEEDPRNELVWNRIRSVVGDPTAVIDFWRGMIRKERPIWGQHSLRRDVATGPVRQRTYHEVAAKVPGRARQKTLLSRLAMSGMPRLSEPS